MVAFEPRLRDFLEQSIAQPVQQPLPARSILELGSGGHGGLLLFLRAGFRQDYRFVSRMTGAAPLFGKWAYGFWQCKNKYNSQDEMLGRREEISRPAHSRRQHRAGLVLVESHGRAGFQQELSRSERDDRRAAQAGLPHHVFVLAVLRSGHRRCTTTWTRKATSSTKRCVAGFHPKGMALYDAFNPDARKYYWNLMDTGLFKMGADAWWLDTDEPETEGRQTPILVNNKVAIGSGARYADLFPLMTTTAVYDGQRSATRSEARLHSLAFGVRGRAAQFGNGVVGRHRIELAQLRAADSRRTEL